MTSAPLRPRLWLLVLVAGAALVGLVALRPVMNYIARDRWDRDPSQIAGTQFQFTTVSFYVFNETGHEALLRVSSGGKVLFEQHLDAEREPDASQVHQVHAYSGRYPYAHIYVQNFDTLTRWLELTELPVGRTRTVDLESIPISDRQGDFSIRITGRGFIVGRAIYGFI